jgi:hypothetical protein
VATPNIEAFNLQVLRAVRFLYEKFPSTTALESSDEIESGTIIWLDRNGIVSGQLQESKPLGRPSIAFITEA